MSGNLFLEPNDGPKHRLGAWMVVLLVTGFILWGAWYLAMELRSVKQAKAGKAAVVAAPVPPAVPILPIIAKTISLAVTPVGKVPSTCTNIILDF